ncbi:MAG: lytic transglycosylase domain-containing protein [Gemmatimonadota bacterium]|nr:lytic transglycosylase domain-containing protein [Gemmatimonadota bacterium]
MLRAAAVSAQDGAVWPWRVTEPWHVAQAWRAAGTPAGLRPAPAEAVVAELAIGRTAQARLLLERHEQQFDATTRLALGGMVAVREGRSRRAARAFADASALAAGRMAGVLAARAAAQFDADGQNDSAARYYERARALLPELAGWLALREASVRSDSAQVEALLTYVPAIAAGVADAIRARVRLEMGDMAGAERHLARAGQPARAAELALARRDSAAARAYARAALAGTDTADLRIALTLWREHLAPRDEGEWVALARAAARRGEWRTAVDAAAAAVSAGDSTVETLLAWGEWLERAGRRRESLGAYALAGRAGEFPRARALLRLGARADADRALRAFADAHPDDPAAPGALYLAGDLTGSDGVLEAVARRWPAHEYASRARLRLARAALAAADSAGAQRQYDAEIAAGGGEAMAARFHRARLRIAARDPGGREALASVARADSLGYYGVVARALLQLPAPTVAPPLPRTPAPAARAVLEQLALLDAAGLESEAGLLLGDMLERAWNDPDTMLDVADGLVTQGRANLAIRLGWRAAGQLTFNHPRVLRAIYPWPDRELVEAEAAKADLDPYLVAGLIRQESWFLATARSRTGAQGYMQLMPATAREVARRLAVPWADGMATVADANIHLGATHLAGLLRRYGGATVPALAAYNAGGTPVSRWLRRTPAADPVRFVEEISYPETQGYVRSVLRHRTIYRALYPPATDP